MTVIARFEVIPVREGSMSTAIAQALQALDRYPVSYETTATDTIIEAETVDQVFEAVQAAHQAIPEDRVITSVEIDEDRRRPQSMHERVASVEKQLGHPPQRTHEYPGQAQPPGTVRTAQQAQPVQPTRQAQPTGSAPMQTPPPGPPARPREQPTGAGTRMPPAGQPSGQGSATSPGSPPSQPTPTGQPTPPGR